MTTSLSLPPGDSRSTSSTGNPSTRSRPPPKSTITRSSGPVPTSHVSGDVAASTASAYIPPSSSPPISSCCTSKPLAPPPLPASSSDLVPVSSSHATTVASTSKRTFSKAVSGTSASSVNLLPVLSPCAPKSSSSAVSGHSSPRAIHAASLYPLFFLRLTLTVILWLLPLKWLLKPLLSCLLSLFCLLLSFPQPIRRGRRYLSFTINSSSAYA